MFEQLAESKIIHHDLHCNNVMFKDGHVVAIGFGFSESPGKEPPVIERVIRELSADDINIADLAFYLQGKYKEKVNVRTGGNWRTKVLGAGSYGVAFDLGNSMVLKVTTDVSEAKAMNHVKQNGHNLKHVVKVLDIFKFKEDDMIPDSGVFGIVMEKLEQLSNDEKVEFDKMMGSLDYVADLSNVFKTDKTWEKHLETFEVTMKKMNVSNQRFSKERFDNMIELCKKYQMPQINDELHSLNIVFLDFHGENVMKRGSDYVMIDLGAASKSPGTEPPTLEKVVKETISGLFEVDKERSDSDLGDYKVDISPEDAPDAGDKKHDQEIYIAETNGIDYNAAKLLIDEFKELLYKKKGITLPESPVFLGKGTRGVALKIDESRVLKLTNDRREAVASNKLMMLGSPKHVVKIYDVFRLKKYSLWGIVQENLKPLSANEKIEFDSCTIEGPVIISDLIKTANGTWDFEQFKSEIRKKYGEKDDVYSSAMESIEKLEQKYHVDKMVEELNSIGIKFLDYHSGNIMKRGDEYVVIDIGYSDVVNGKEPDVLESIIKEITESDSVNYEDDFALDVRYRKLAPLLKKNGIVVDTKKFLGQGSYGSAYECTWNGKKCAIKGTEDESEALASNHIKGKKLKHVVNIYDVFKLPIDDSSDGTYCIVQELLTQTSDKEKEDIHWLAEQLWDAKTGKSIIDGDIEAVVKDFAALMHDREKDLDRAIDIINMIDFGGMIEEIKEQNIEFFDYHEGNIMKRGKDFVVIDLGASASPGGEPRTIESVIRSIVSEAQADMVGVTIGRFQPFHKGHAEMIRDLTAKFNKVIVLITGNKKDKKNPFSYETRVEMMMKSLPDVWNKIKVYKGEYEGKASGFIPAVLSDIVNKGDSTLKGDTAVNILVGEDRFENVKDQVERAKQAKASGTEVMADPNLMTVQKLSDVKNDVDRISGTRVRDAIMKGDKESFKKLVDPHLVSNEADFNTIFEKLKTELGGQPTPPKGGVEETKDVVEMIIAEVDGGGAMYGAPGSYTTTRGTSGWSSGKMSKGNVDDGEWQNNITKKLQLMTSGSADVVTQKD
jgi:cytidyltransferase-like protein